jgi:serine/threonine protein kinase/Tfp pilus assembly protein PilF
MQTWNPRANDLFLEARGLSGPTERCAFLDRACGGDAALREDVQSLLDVDDRAGSLLERPAELVGSLENLRPVPDSLIGTYKLLQQIGEGGMGTVYMAEQTHPINRRVAVKVIKSGMDTRKVIARFEAERQALAMMDHPNIAKVLDAGETQEGRPYFVMELVRGVPITKYCDECRLTAQQRLELFVQVCLAVQHAHQKGIIHRDLKPSNVMIAPYDGKPVVKVIDFGIAKASGARLTEKTLFTEFGAVIGSLEYMSPEQAELNNQDIDTRSDIYSLGVLLYELLTGSPPISQQRLKQEAFLDMLRMIREEEPPKPSTRLSASTDSLPAISAQRKTEPAKLTRLVRGELDWIVMKALDKDRNRRYETANGLAADIQRFLADEPVQACPPSAGYRLRKFTKRNQARLATASIFSAAILTTATVIGWAAWDRHTRIAEQSRQQASQYEKLSNQVRSILNDVEQWERQENWTNALAAAQRAEAVLTAANSDDPELIAEVRQHFVDLSAVESIEAARLSRGGNEWYFHFEAADQEFENAFASLEIPVRALSAEEVGKRIRSHQTVAPVLVAALDDWITICRPRAHPNTRHLLDCAQTADTDPFRRQIRDAVIAQDQKKLEALRTDPHFPRHSASTAYLLASVLPRIDQRIEVLRSAQNEHPQDFWLNVSLGFNLCSSRPERYVDAVAYFQAAIATRPHSLLRPVLGYALYRVGRTAEAQRVLEKSIEMHPRLASGHLFLSDVLHGNGRLDDAIASACKARDLDPLWTGPHGNLSCFLQEKGKLEESIAAAQKAIERWPQNSWAYCNLGIALRKQGQLDASAEALGKAVEFDPDLPMWRVELGRTQLAQGRAAEALESLQTAAELQPVIHGTVFSLGDALLRLKRWHEALPIFRDAIRLMPEHAFSHYYLGVVLLNIGQFEESIGCNREAIRLKPDLGLAHWNLGLLLMKQGKFLDALASLRRGRELMSRNPGWKNANQTAQQIEKCERMMRLYPRFDDVVAGLVQPADSVERVAFAELCLTLRQNHGAAVRLYAEAFAAEPELAEATNAHRYNAACAAALAAAVKGNSNPAPADERARLRRQAQEWLQAELSVLAKRANTETTLQRLEHWQQDPDLIEVRDKTALAKLPETENAAWLNFWSGVADLELRTIEAVYRDALGNARKQHGHSSRESSNHLAMLGQNLLQQKKYSDAKPILRECLAIRSEMLPDDWRTFNTKSMLGGCLLGQKRFAEAEPLLLAGFEGMMQREAKIPKDGKVRIIETLERLVNLYGQMEKKDDATKWRKRLESRLAAKAMP